MTTTAKKRKPRTRKPKTTEQMADELVAEAERLEELAKTLRRSARIMRGRKLRSVS